MTTSLIQKSAFSGHSAVKPQNKLARKVGSFNGGRFTMRRIKGGPMFFVKEIRGCSYPPPQHMGPPLRRTVKSAPQSIWYGPDPPKYLGPFSEQTPSYLMLVYMPMPCGHY